MNITETLNRIGLDEEKSRGLSVKLNELLADYVVFYQNVRGYHWHVKGRDFFELHAKFEELYDNLAEKIDEIAERILTLGFTPDHNFSTYLKNSKIGESPMEENGAKALKDVVRSLGIIIPLQRELLEMAADAGDEGTSAKMSDYIKEQEKLVWMYSAYLS